MYLHSRLWHEPLIGPRAPFSVVDFEPPVDKLDEQYPLRLTTGRRLDSYNTGVQTELYASPLRRPETLDLSFEDGRHYSLQEGEKVRVSSRRGSVVAPVRFDPGLPQGLAFLTTHFHDQVATNDLTIDAVDPKSGTSEFKATAIRIDKISGGLIGSSSGPGAANA
jgi:formate dehydrogenase major subunit